MAHRLPVGADQVDFFGVGPRLADHLEGGRGERLAELEVQPRQIVDRRVWLEQVEQPLAKGLGMSLVAWASSSNPVAGPDAEIRASTASMPSTEVPVI